MSLSLYNPTEGTISITSLQLSISPNSEHGMCSFTSGQYDEIGSLIDASNLQLKDGDILYDQAQSQDLFAHWRKYREAMCGPVVMATTTANRPTFPADECHMIIDTTLGKPIWWNGTNWIDATGATV